MTGKKTSRKREEKHKASDPYQLLLTALALTGPSTSVMRIFHQSPLRPVGCDRIIFRNFGGNTPAEQDLKWLHELCVLNLGRCTDRVFLRNGNTVQTWMTLCSGWPQPFQWGNSFRPTGFPSAAACRECSVIPLTPYFKSGGLVFKKSSTQ